MNCEKCGVQVAPQSAIAGMWCWRCGEKEEERLGKMVDELPTIAPDQTLSEGELARAKQALAAVYPLISNEPPASLIADATYGEVKQEWEAESGKPAPTKKKGPR